MLDPPADSRMLALVTAETTRPDVDFGPPATRQRALAIRWVFPVVDGSITPLGVGTTTIGRDANLSATLAGPSVSRRHAEIRRQAGRAPMLRDLDSRNGVFLNGRRVTQAPLKLHDVLRLGDWVGILTTVAADDSAGGTDWTLEEIAPGYWAGPVLSARLAAVRLIAATELTVVIQGETGAGKEGVARAIHGWSGRKGPFMALNCAALPETLAESELFGYRKGAFSSADRASPGFLRAADGGTLFLDEIADLSLPVQAKLLRAIENREVIPLGETGPVRIDLRLVAASHIPLRDAVANNRFRNDLFARLKGFVLEVPPLRERVEEIPLLFAKLLAQRWPAGPSPQPDAGFVEALCAHRWPYNMRDLTSLATRLVALYPQAARLDRSILDDLLDSGDRDVSPAPAREADPRAGGDPDAEEILAALKASGGNVRQAAVALRISRARLYRLMDKIDLLDLSRLRSRR